MNTFIRVHTRMFLLSLAAAAALLALTAATASAVNVHLRVEAPDETLFNGWVNTGPRTVQTVGGNCTGAVSDVAVTGATTVTALTDWLASAAAPVPEFMTAYGGTYVCRIGAYAENYPNGSWLLKINNLDSPPPAGYVTAGDGLNENDDVLVYFSANDPNASLDLRLPEAARPGESVTGYVDAWTNFSGDVRSAAKNAVVFGGGASAATDAEGKFTIAFAAAGRYLVSATKAGAVRGSAWIAIAENAVQQPVPEPAKTFKRRHNRFQICNKRYKTGSRRHRRCIRKVRAMQVAECRRADRRDTAFCAKVRARVKKYGS